MNCTGLKDIGITNQTPGTEDRFPCSKLYATNLSSNAYAKMFANCYSLSTAYF